MILVILSFNPGRMSRANQDLMRQKRLAALQSLATTSSLGSDAIRNIAPLQHGPTPYFASQADSPSSGSVKPVSSSSRPASHSSKIHTLSSSSSYSKPASHSSKTLSPSYSKPASHSSKIHTLSSSSSYSKPASHSLKPSPPLTQAQLLTHPTSTPFLGPSPEEEPK